MLQQLIGKFGRDREKFDEAEKDLKIQRMVEQKQKSSNERELERFHEEFRQKRIKRELEFHRMRERKALWSANMLKAKNMFRGGKTLLHEDKHVLDNGRHSFMKRGNLIHGR